MLPNLPSAPFCLSSSVSAKTNLTQAFFDGDTFPHSAHALIHANCCPQLHSKGLLLNQLLHVEAVTSSSSPCFSRLALDTSCCCFDWILRRWRHGSVTTRKPQQYWCVYDYERTLNQFNNTFHTHAKNNINALRILSLKNLSKSGTRLRSTFCTKLASPSDTIAANSPHATVIC